MFGWERGVHRQENTMNDHDDSNVRNDKEIGKSRSSESGTGRMATPIARGKGVIVSRERLVALAALAARVQKRPVHQGRAPKAITTAIPVASTHKVSKAEFGTTRS